jgi:aspartyl/asparaginyl beta-hydroxylase (cupin superfamily)
LKRRKVEVEAEPKQKIAKKNKKFPKSKGKRKKVRSEREKAAKLQLQRKEEQDKALLEQIRNSISYERYHVRYDSYYISDFKKEKINDQVKKDHPELAYLISRK